jgi:AP-1 complex subunit beta-1
MIQLVLSAATTETDNPDLRDRAYVYWRLLSTDPEVGTRILIAWVGPCCPPPPPRPTD